VLSSFESCAYVPRFRLHEFEAAPALCSVCWGNDGTIWLWIATADVTMGLWKRTGGLLLGWQAAEKLISAAKSETAGAEARLVLKNLAAPFGASLAQGRLRTEEEVAEKLCVERKNIPQRLKPAVILWHLRRG
jgi:hypothetical protein